MMICGIHNIECEYTDSIITTVNGLTYCKQFSCPVMQERKRKRNARLAPRIASMTEYERVYFNKHYPY